METIIIDDEEKALDMLEFYLENYFPNYKIIGRYTDVHHALSAILKDKPEVIFLDVNMPSGSGIDLMSKIKHLNCKVILLTAHSEYAIEAIKNDAFDYLLKPLNLEELNRTDAKIRASKPMSAINTQSKVKIKISNQVYIFDIDEIIYAYSEGNYTTIHSTCQKPLLISKNLKKVHEEYLFDLPFFRSHQSYIVNINHIANYSNCEIILSSEIKIGLSSKNYTKLSSLI